MLEIAKEIVIALINNECIAANNNADSNIKEVNKAINDITKKLTDVNMGNYDK